MQDNKAEIKKLLAIKEANGQSKWTIQSQRNMLEKPNHFLNGKPFCETTEDDIISFFSTTHLSNRCPDTACRVRNQIVCVMEPNCKDSAYSNLICEFSKIRAQMERV